MDAYLQRFERYAKSQNWPNDEWAVHLSAFFRRKSPCCLLAHFSRRRYDVLKEALFKRFEMTEDGFRKRFRNFRLEVGDTFAQFSTRLA